MKSSGAMILEVMNAILAIKTFLLVEISQFIDGDVESCLSTHNNILSWNFHSCHVISDDRRLL